MAKEKTPKYQQTFTLTKDEYKDYHDRHNGSLYDIAPSRNGESYTVLFYTDQTYKEIRELLEKQYTFQKNKNNCGIETGFTLSDKRVFLNLYNNKRLLIQGGGSKLWRNSVFRKLSEKLSPNQAVSKNENLSDGEQDDDVIYKYTETPVRTTVIDDYQTPPSRVKNVVNKLINKLRSPVVNDKAYSPETNDTVRKKVKQTEQKTEVQVDDEVTLLKTVYMPSPESDDSSCNPAENHKQQLEIQKTENKQLQDTFKDIMSQSKVLKSENERLQKTVVDLQSQNESLKANLKSTSKKLQESECQIKTLKAQKSKDSAQSLILEEENNKLMKKVESISKEKTQLVDQLMKNSAAKDGIEDKIELEIRDLKDVLLQEMHDLRKQIEISRTIQNKTTTTSSSSVDRRENFIDPERDQPTTVMSNHNSRHTINPAIPSTIENNGNSMENTAFIAGDSITQILSSKRMSDANLKVNIKTHSGGRIRTVENSVIKMAEDNPRCIKQTKAIVLHVGTNNVSDADQPETISDEIKDLADTIKNINNGAKVIVSSILPRRNDRLVNNVISATNQSLRQACEEKGYHFLDNTPRFMINGVPDSSLYRDNLHLNPRGGKLLGENIRQKLNTILNLSEKSNPEFTNNRQETNFQHGRQQGRRRFTNKQDMLYMPIPFFQPPWFNNQYQRQQSMDSQMNRGFINRRPQP